MDIGSFCTVQSVMERSEGVALFLCILSAFLALCLTYQIWYHDSELSQLKMRVDFLESSKQCGQKKVVEEVSTEEVEAKESISTRGVVKRSSDSPLTTSMLLSSAMSRVVQSELRETLGCKGEEELGTECVFPAGPEGEKGERGPQGEKGARGEQGQMGVRGPKGDTGPPGLIGPPGVQEQCGRVEFRAVDCKWHRIGACGAACEKVRDIAVFCPPGYYTAGFGISSKVQTGRYNKMIYCCTVQ